MTDTEILNELLNILGKREDFKEEINTLKRKRIERHLMEERNQMTKKLGQLYQSLPNYDKYDKIEELLKQGADSNCVRVGVNKETPLLVSCREYLGWIQEKNMENIARSRRMIELLLSFGADPNLQNVHGRTALHYLVTYAPFSSSLLKLILDYGADPEIQDVKGYQGIISQQRGTALHAICMRDPEEICRYTDGLDAVLCNIKLLLWYGADPTTKNSSGLKPSVNSFIYPDGRNHQEVNQLLDEHMQIQNRKQCLFSLFQ